MFHYRPALIYSAVIKCCRITGFAVRNIRNFIRNYIRSFCCAPSRGPLTWFASDVNLSRIIIQNATVVSSNYSRQRQRFIVLVRVSHITLR